MRLGRKKHFKIVEERVNEKTQSSYCLERTPTDVRNENNDGAESGSGCICDAAPSTSLSVESKQRLARRGPDCLRQMQVSQPCANARELNAIEDDVGGCGSAATPNSFISSRATSSVLHTRGSRLVEQPIRDGSTGSLLSYNGEIYAGLPALGEHDNDGECLFRALSGCAHDDAILRVLDGLQGEFALVYLDHARRNLWVYKDKIGRKSLLFAQRAEDDCLWYSSLCTTAADCSVVDWQELQAGVVVKHHLSHPMQTLAFPLIDVASISLAHLPQPAGICAVNFAPKHDQLLTVVKLTDSSADDHPEQDDVALGRVRALLTEAVRRRLRCDHPTRHLGILFSGGLDSTLLAALAHRCLAETSASSPSETSAPTPSESETLPPPPDGMAIDLLNVAFAVDAAGFERCPDRVTGVASHRRLQQLHPTRRWNFVRINVTHDELRCCRRERISPLIQPAASVLDDTIGCALWFAARGSGTCEDADYTSPCRLLLAGAGADELFGGYSRYRTRYSRGGLSALADEMQMDQRRLWIRNYGRDDRVLSDHGREARYPFLDEQLVAAVNAMPLHSKCDLTLPRGVGEKRVLRRLADELGLSDVVSALPKRAIQFGSRIAKIDGRNEKADDHCARLQQA